MDTLLRRLFGIGARRGVAGSRAWATLAVVTGALRLVRRMHRAHDEVVWRQALQPGDSFCVSVTAGPASRVTRRAKRSAKRS